MTSTTATTTDVRADSIVSGATILVGPRRGTRSVRRVISVEHRAAGPVRPGGGRMVVLDVAGAGRQRLAVTADAMIEVVR